MADFSWAFSQHRDATGGSSVLNGNNPKAAFFVGTSMSKWATTSATSLSRTFYDAREMNADLSAWKVGKVTDLKHTFHGASKFAGTGLGSWNTTSVTVLPYTFSGAREMNSDLSACKVAKVTTPSQTFRGASKFAGTGLGSWDTTSVISLSYTFNGASEMNSDLSAWKVDKVKKMDCTFRNASKFAGTGLAFWDTTSVTTLAETFFKASEMNSDLSKWNVAKVTDIKKTFREASKFTGTGVGLWNIAKVTDMTDTFFAVTSVTTCNKRKIADSWASISALFVSSTTYNTDWAADTCPCPLGQAYTSASASCADCTTGWFSTTTDSSPCTPHSISSCGTGEGFVPGTTTADDAVCAGCGGGKYSGSIGRDACVPHTSPPCATGSGFVAGTATVDATCKACGYG